MQLYTKILIGMGVGAVIGLTLGPKSSFLEADLYKIDDPSKVELQFGRDDSDTVLTMPTSEPIDFKILETVRESRRDKNRQLHDVVVMAKVSFEYSKRLALHDRDGEFSRELGGVGVGDEIAVWLRTKLHDLDDGGFVVSPQPISSVGNRVISVLKPVGDLFMRLIKMVIVPLVFASLVVGVASLGDVRKLGRLGGKTLGLYLTTTAAAVTIGMLCAHGVNPGSFVADEDRAALVAQFEGAAGGKMEKAAVAPEPIDVLLEIVPTNPVASLASGTMLQIIFFALLLGIALTLLKEERSRQVVSFFDTIQEAMILIIHMVMATAPYGVAALIAEVIGTSGWSILSALLVYAATVVLGLLLLAGGVYGTIVTVLARLPFLDFLRAARPAQLIAFSTSSSSATMPVTMQCAEQNLGISKPVSSFVIPLGATVNMDGTALYQGVAAIFIAQVFQIDLSLGAQLGIVATATAASIGAAGVPGAGMITLAMVLTTAGIPPVGVALILGFDRILDMFRTAVNVTGDLAVTSVMAVSEGEKLQLLTDSQDARNPDRGFEGRLDRESHAVKPTSDDQ